MKIWIPFWLVTGFIFVILVLRNAEVMTLAGFILFAALVASAIVFRDPLRLWFTRKLGEWRNDLKQLGLWTRLAFQRDRDAQATATMTHQMSFL